ncbi:MAG: T9SS type A sorting domain-containing protein [Flavobacteriales bacterium]|nr:T9SS type A sorting domain-containing protein [Flavobacteriales bacterium]MCB9166883.1 T9SS type A sorting domain-containing protein [Flavobacteriales bacterium]
MRSTLHHASIVRISDFLFVLVVISLSPSLSRAQQTLWLETFDGGTSTTGFTVDNNTSDCYWVYAPDSVHTGMSFNQDFGGAWPAGPGFDSSFVFLDSDECGGTSVTVNSFLNSPVFDASTAGNYFLHFSQQFRSRLQSFTRIEAYNGTIWTEVYYVTGTDIGYPNPARDTTVDVTAGLGGSATAQVRFQFSAGWDWWWALDSISVTYEPSTGILFGGLPGLSIGPNPAQDRLYVRSIPQAATLLRVYDMLGRTVLERPRNTELSLEDLRPGAYILEAADHAGHAFARARFVKE